MKDIISIIYMTGIVISFVGFMVYDAYFSVKMKKPEEDLIVIMLLSVLWPLIVPRAIGYYLGSK